MGFTVEELIKLHGVNGQATQGQELHKVRGILAGHPAMWNWVLTWQKRLRFTELELGWYDPERIPAWERDKKKPPLIVIHAHSLYPDLRRKGMSTGLWWPLGENASDTIQRIKRHEYELRAQAYLEYLYQHLNLQVFINPDDWSGAPSITAWIKRPYQVLKWHNSRFYHSPIGQGAEWLGKYDESITVGKIKGAREWLQLMNQLAYEAKAPGKFYCTFCGIVRLKEELEETVFASYCCKDCYVLEPQAKKEVDESRRPGFYN